MSSMGAENSPLLFSTPKTFCWPQDFCAKTLIIAFLLFLSYASLKSVLSSKVHFEQSMIAEEKWIYLIRHNEKYTDQDYGLSQEGLAHALCLSWYFESFPYGPPQALWAENSEEERAIQTLLPTSRYLDLPLHSKWDKHHIDDFIQDVYHNSRKHDVILIAYEHHYLPIIAQRLGCTKCLHWNVNPLGNHSQGNIYNMTWVFSLTRFKELFVYSQNYRNEVCQKTNLTYEFSTY